ncbi:hypothetical protein ES703_107396 [subsurface metagenome]
MSMPNLIYLPDKIVEEAKDTATSQKTHRCWSWEELDPLDITTRNVSPSFEKQEGTGIVSIETEIQSQEELLSGHYYSWIEVPSGEIFGVSGGVALVSGVAVDSNAVFSGGLIIRGQIPTAHFYICPAAEKTRDLTQDLEQLSWDKCRQVLFVFTSYAKEILKLKGIAITETRIRNWQAIEDTNWKQCILDITVKAESHIALRIWDELSEELQKFINTQPEVFRPFLKDKLSLDVKWV